MEHPRPYADFLTATARNIQQAREVKEGRTVYQVGPTIYRGLWYTDGNYLLEAARFLGQDKEGYHRLYPMQSVLWLLHQLYH
jgi:hypothetical protein